MSRKRAGYWGSLPAKGTMAAAEILLGLAILYAIVVFDLATSSGRTKVGRLVSTELIKLIDYRTDLPPVLGVGIDIVQSVSKRRKFRT